MNGLLPVVVKTIVTLRALAIVVANGICIARNDRYDFAVGIMTDLMTGLVGLFWWTATALLLSPIVDDRCRLMVAVELALNVILGQASIALSCSSVIVGPRGLEVLLDGRPSMIAPIVVHDLVLT